MKCACQTLPHDASEAPESFGRVRSDCPALRLLLIPDELWPRFRDWHLIDDTVAHHRSSLLLAWERGRLGHFISAVHRYLICNGQIRRETIKQYRQDLREAWMLEPKPLRRHQRYRVFAGRLAELQFAEWIAKQGWEVIELEAIGARADVIAHLSGENRHTAFEMKLIGIEDMDFIAILQSLANQQNAARFVSPYDAANYLLFRIYEAAKQLCQIIEYRRIAVIAIEEAAWHRFALPLDSEWIDWKSPRFFNGAEGASAHWNNFLASKKRQYPELPGALAQIADCLDEIWLLQRSRGYHYDRYKVVLGHRT